MKQAIKTFPDKDCYGHIPSSMPLTEAEAEFLDNLEHAMRVWQNGTHNYSFKYLESDSDSFEGIRYREFREEEITYFLGKEIHHRHNTEKLAQWYFRFYRPEWNLLCP